MGVMRAGRPDAIGTCSVVGLRRRTRASRAAALAGPLATLATLATLPVFAAAAGASPIAVVDDRGVEVRLPAPPRRIVSLLPSLTETVCALDACDRLVGVDRWSNHPPQVRTLPRTGGLEATSIEALVAMRPDLVLLAASARAAGRLESLGIRVAALEPATHADVARVARQVAALLGHADPQASAAGLQRTIDAQVEAASRAVPAAMRGLRVYYEVGAGPYAAGEASFIGHTLARLGLRNVAPAALGPFPQVAPEFVLRADPQIVMIAEREAPGLAARPGWRRIAAIREGRVCGFDPQTADAIVRPGPRLGEGALRIADCLHRIAAREETASGTDAEHARGAPLNGTRP
jgi:iron complex transport system substrate-binding protein